MIFFFFDFLVRWLLRNAGPPPQGEGEGKGGGGDLLLGRKKRKQER